MSAIEETNGHLPKGLDDRIADIHNGLSTKHKRLARFVLDNKYFLSFASASEAGEITGTSAATVVRFAQSLGYEGFSEMQAAIRSELPSYMTAVDRIQGRLKAQPPPNDIPQTVFHTDISNIERTASALSQEKLDKAVQTIVSSDRILVVGAGLSTASAFFLTHSLRIIGLDVRFNLNEGLSLSVDTALLGSQDCVIAIDMWRYVRSTIDAVRKAKQEGAQIIAITDSIVSPLAKIADFAFEVITDGVSHSLSSAATMSLLNVLIAAVSYQIPEQTIDSLRRVDSAYRENKLLLLE